MIHSIESVVLSLPRLVKFQSFESLLVFLTGNVLKEIVEPAGAVIRCRDFTLGDPTISTLELWGAEYQESDAILVRNESIPLLKKIGEREKVDVSFVGTITGNSVNFTR